MIMTALSVAMICIEWLVEYPTGSWLIGWGYLGIAFTVLYSDMRIHCK